MGSRTLKKMTPEESGHKGGIATRDNHSFTCPFMKKPCVIMVQEYFAKTGSKGGDETSRRHGPEFYRRLGKFSGRGITKEKRIAKFGYDPLEKANPASAVSTPGRGGKEQKQEAGVVSTKTIGCLRQSQPGVRKIDKS